MPDEIYYDNSATTRTREESAKLVYEMLTDCYGNPSSLHRRGFLAQQRLDKAREQTAATLGCQSGEIYFTSGGTEADNIAILGAARAQQRMGKKIVTTAIEHDAVLNTVKFLEGEGWEIVRLKPDREGKITAQQVLDAVDNQTVLVSMMAVNNEVGSVLPVAQVSRLLRKSTRGCCCTVTRCRRGANSRCVWARHWMWTFCRSAGIRFMRPRAAVRCTSKRAAAASGQLWRRAGKKYSTGHRRDCQSVCDGSVCPAADRRIGGKSQQSDLDSGCAFGRFDKLPDICINSPADATPYILNFSALGVRSEIMLHFLEEKGIYVSSGSACAKGGASHVLQAMGLERERADSAIRLSFGRYNTPEQVPLFLEALEEGLKRFRR